MIYISVSRRLQEGFRSNLGRIATERYQFSCELAMKIYKKNVRQKLSVDFRAFRRPLSSTLLDENRLCGEHERIVENMASKLKKSNTDAVHFQWEPTAQTKR